MSILIKGMKAPTSCSECRMSGWSNFYQLYKCDVCDQAVAKYASEYQMAKPEWCPIIEIPEHGDLIDRDALEPDICQDWNGIFTPDDAYSEKLICNAPTVIEAEGSEDDERTD